MSLGDSDCLRLIVLCVSYNNLCLTRVVRWVCIHLVMQSVSCKTASSHGTQPIHIRVTHLEVNICMQFKADCSTLIAHNNILLADDKGILLCLIYLNSLRELAILWLEDDCTLTAVVSSVLGNVEHNSLCHKSTSIDLCNPIIRNLNVKINVVTHLDLYLITFAVDDITIFCKNQSILLSLDDNDCLRQTIFLIGKLYLGWTLVIVLVWLNVKIVGVGWCGTSNILRNPIYIGRYFHCNINIACYLYCNSLAVRWNNVLILWNYDCRLATRLIDGHDLIKFAALNINLALTLLSVVVLVNKECESRGLHRTSTLILNPILCGLVNGVLKVDIGFDYNLNLATCGFDLKFWRSNGQRILLFLRNGNSLWCSSRLDANRSVTLIRSVVILWLDCDWCIARSTTLRYHAQPAIGTVINNLSNPIGSSREWNALLIGKLVKRNQRFAYSNLIFRLVGRGCWIVISFIISVFWASNNC